MSNAPMGVTRSLGDNLDYLNLEVWKMAKRKAANGASVLAGISTLFNTAKTLSNNFDVLGKKKRQRNERFAYLWAKYRDGRLVHALMSEQFWEGQTASLLKDSLGPPAAIDNIQMKSRKREIWKYQPNGINRYLLRITLDDDVVVAWEQKG